MSLENEEELAEEQDIEIKMTEEISKRPKRSYTRDFLLSLSNLAVCEKLPDGFDQSLLSEFADTSNTIQDWPRISGSLSLQSFRHDSYGSSPPTRGDSSYNPRGIHGRWESRSSSGRSDKDSDTQSDRESETGRHYNSQTRRSWQNPEHDGLLGSGSFPRPSGYVAEVYAPKLRANDKYHLSRSSEPYQPPRPYKAVPHPRRETHDSYNHETFGSSDYTSEDRAEEERKRRASFELMRKEQVKTFQEKQKLNSEKGKEESVSDINILSEDHKDDIKLLGESIDMEKSAILAAPQNEFGKSLLPSQAPARPLVPPGFKCAALEKKDGAKSVIHSLPGENKKNVIKKEKDRRRIRYPPMKVKKAIDIEKEMIRKTMVRNLDLVDELSVASDKTVLNGISDNQEEKHLAQQIVVGGLQQEKMSNHTLFTNRIEETRNLLAAPVVPDEKISTNNQSHKSLNELDMGKALEDDKYVGIDAEVSSSKVVDASSQDRKTSILDKLFGSASTGQTTGSPTFAESQNNKMDDFWSPKAVQDSKFAHWFDEEEKKHPEDISLGRSTNLLSLIVGGENAVPAAPDGNLSEQIVPDLPSEITDTRNLQATAKVFASDGIAEHLSSISKTDAARAVLTCEDLEQSILSEISGSSSGTQPAAHGLGAVGPKSEQPKPKVDDFASQHLLSLLQKRSGLMDMAPLSNLDAGSLDTLHKFELGSMGNVLPDSRGESAGTAAMAGKPLTLETLFGSDFMQELQSAEAPVSIQKSTVASARTDVSELHGLSFPIDDGLFAGAVDNMGSSTATSEMFASNNKQQRKSDNSFEAPSLHFDNSQNIADCLKLQTEVGSRIGGFDGADLGLPEEDSLITVSDPVNLQRSMFGPPANTSKPELLSSSDTPFGIAEKLAALDIARKDDWMVGRQEKPHFHRGLFDIMEPENLFQNLHARTSSPQFHPPQMNHGRPSFHSFETHPANLNPQMKFMGPENIIHEAPPSHHFPANMLQSPFQHHNVGLVGFDPPAHHPLLQQMHAQGNFPPPQVIRGFPRGAPIPPHPNNHVSGFAQEINQMQGFPFSHRQPNFNSLGVPLPVHDGGGGGGGNDHEALQRLIGMELRSNSKQMHPFAAGGHGQGAYGHELDAGGRI
ncbi:hypothetical protein RJ641_016750 [Dillenia turbinata]|uniref:Uncharacterized protein n=1 Tax=Dillenia turbinata TaxID=194707 RepID=A0AAN8UYZ8_9MAGN